MTALDLSPEAVAKMLEGVTPGPWSYQVFDTSAYVYGPHGNLIAEIAGALGGTAPANARFIAYAREAVPVLAARVAELEAQYAHVLGHANKQEDRAEAAEAKLAELEARHEDDRAENARLTAEVERLRGALMRIVEWSDAYPTPAFPEPDFARAAVALSAAGMSLDVVSASNMRHATKGVGEIARAALEGEKP